MKYSNLYDNHDHMFLKSFDLSIKNLFDLFLQAFSLYAERHIEARDSSLYTKKIYSSIMGSDSSEVQAICVYLPLLTNHYW